MNNKNRLKKTILIAALLAFTSQTQAATKNVIFDFDSTGLEKSWGKPQKGMEIEWKLLLNYPNAEDAPSGKVLKITSPRLGYLFSLANTIPDDIAEYSTLSFWIYRSEEDREREPNARMALQMYAEKGPKQVFKIINLTFSGWKKIEIPLRHINWAKGRVGDWSKVEHLVFLVHNPIEIYIDNITLTKEPGKTGYTSVKEFKEHAFPNNEPDEIKVLKSTGLAILTNAPELTKEGLWKFNSELRKLMRHLKKVNNEIQKDLPFLEKPTVPAKLIIFETEEEYRDFPPKYVKLISAQINKPQADGFTFRGVATSYWNPKYGTIRPVYTHEYIHSYLDWSFKISENNWVQEGLATHYQMIFHPQPEIAEKIIAKIDLSEYLSFQKLLDGGPVELQHYWQAMTIIQMLAEDPKYKNKYPELFNFMQKYGTTAMNKPLKALYNKTWKQFENDWKKFTKERYSKLINN